MANVSNISASYEVNVLFTKAKEFSGALLGRLDSSIKTIATRVFDSAIIPLQNRLTFAATWISKTRGYKLYKKWDPIDVVIAAGQLGSNAYAAIDGATDKIKNVTEKAKDWMETNIVAKNALAGLQFVPLLFAPSAIQKIGKSVTKIFSSAIGIKKFDAVLAITAKMAVLAEGVKAAAEGLLQFGLVAKDAITWTSGVAAAAIVLSAANIAIASRSLYKKFVFKKQAEIIVNSPKKNHSEAPLNYAGGVDSMLNDPKASKMLGVTAEQMYKIKRFSKSHEANPSTSRKIYSNLKKRINSRMFSDKLTIIAATISLVASVIMLAVPGLQPLALGIAAVSMAVIVGKLVTDRMDNVKWNAWIERIPQELPEIENKPVLLEGQLGGQSKESVLSGRQFRKTKALQNI